MATDPIDPRARARLNQAMEDRRTELGLHWREVAAAAGDMSTEGLRNIRKGPSGIPPFRRRQVERALQWPSGEIDRILGDLSDRGELTDDEILAMSANDLESYAKSYGRDRGVAALRQFVLRVRKLQQEKLDSVLADPQQVNSGIDSQPPD